MTKAYKFFFLISIYSVFFSCEKEVILDFDQEEENLAIFSLFSPSNIFTIDNNFNIEVTKTQSILDNSDFTYIRDARVTIITESLEEPENVDNNEVDNGNSQEHEIISEEAISYSIGETDRIIYRTDNTIPSNGFSYKLIVDHPDYPKVTAESYVPKTKEIKNLEFSEFETSTANQLPGFTRYNSNASFELDNSSNSADQYHLLVYLVYQNGQRFNLETVTIEEDILMEQLGADAIIVNANSSPVFFGAHFDNSTFHEDTQQLNFNIGFSLGETSNPIGIYVELRTVSEQYHNYFVEGYRLSQASNNQFFSRPNNISNNIEGGFGVFAGYSVFDEVVPFSR